MNKTINKFIRSNWTITLTATMLGIFVGIYLNNLVADKSLRKQVSAALVKVENEIGRNNEILQTSYGSHKKFYDVILFLNASLDENGELVTNAQSMKKFKENFPNVFNVTDSVIVKDEKYK